MSCFRTMNSIRSAWKMLLGLGKRNSWKECFDMRCIGVPLSHTREELKQKAAALTRALLNAHATYPYSISTRSHHHLSSRALALASAAALSAPTLSEADFPTSSIWSRTDSSSFERRLASSRFRLAVSCLRFLYHRGC